MGSVIKSRTFSSVVDNRIQLSNSQCARQWSSTLGTSWSQIRVGARVAMTTTGADLSGTPRFAFGIQKGTTNLWQDAGGPDHWCGFVSDGTWHYGTGNSVPRYYLSLQFKVAKKVGTTLTTGGNTGDNTVIADATQANRHCLFVDITKGSPNFTFNLFCMNITNSFVETDVALATYLANVVLPSPSVTNHSRSGGITLAVDEATNGYFDSVGFAWDRTDALIEISDTTVVRLA